MQTDYARLYTYLGIDQECSLDEFKRACRQRINQLHPDRRASDAAAAPIAVDEIIAMYTRAVRFHRQHGRLPGATSAPRRVNVPRLSPRPAGGSALATQTNAAAGSGHRTALVVVIVLCLSITALVLWAGDDTAAAVDTAGIAAQSDIGLPAARPVRATHLKIGMDAATVRAIQGDPIQSGGGIWEYGPSWLRIERNQLVDWHSSTMHPLEVTTDEPPPRMAQSP